MKKKMMCLVLSALMVFGSVMHVSAEEISGNQWQVEYDGKKMNASFDTADLNKEIYQLQPGDTAEIKVDVHNSSKQLTDWYMTNEIVKSLEDSSVANGGAYSYQLLYADHTGKETTLFDSETLVADEIKDATDAMEDYFYLDRLQANETGSLRLRIGLDGETQGNNYQNTLASLQMNFAVEEVKAEIVYQTGETVKVDKVVKTNIKTGDQTKILTACLLVLISGLILLAVAIYMVKKNSKKTKKGARRHEKNK